MISSSSFRMPYIYNARPISIIKLAVTLRASVVPQAAVIQLLNLGHVYICVVRSVGQPQPVMVFVDLKGIYG